MLSIIEPLLKIQIFADLEAETLIQLQPYLLIRNYLSDEIIFHEGDRLPAKFYALVDGIIEIKKIAASRKNNFTSFIC
jgi:CRP/FNR family transcriptional regulator, cyclic AMP receptor protein